MSTFFKVLHLSKKSKARLGQIKTAHGVVNTPAFVPVATKGSIKSLPPAFTKDIGIQVAFVNTYHLVTHPGADVIAKAGGIHNYAKLDIPLMSDSGGFQVFSLAEDKKARYRNFLSQLGPTPVLSRGFPRSEKNLVSSLSKKPLGFLATQHKGEEVPYVVKISDDGVKFRSVFDGEMIEFTPEKSIAYQQKIGADLIMAFDECTYYPATHQYAEKAMERTHEWLKRCIAKVRKWKIGMEANFQFLYGIIQGATFEDLRKKSAKFVTSQKVDGIAIGGVSVGETKAEMRDQVKWVAPYLPKDKPVHLLGVGQIDDIIDLVKYGIDTFDCVEPTRLARMGILYMSEQILSRFSLPSGFASLKAARLHAAGSPSSRATCSDQYDVLKGKYRHDLSKVDDGCDCYTCKNFTKSYLHHLFKQRELLGYTLATYHNLWVMEKLMEKIRIAIEQDRL